MCSRERHPHQMRSTRLMKAVDGPLVILVDDAEQVIDSPLGQALEAVLRSGRAERRAVALAGGTAELNAAAFRGLVAEARRSRAGLLLSPAAPSDAELFGIRLPRTVMFSGPPGRGVMLSRGRHEIVQVANAANK